MQKPPPEGAVFAFLTLYAPRTLATTYSPLASTIGSRELNFRVRNGNGCDLSDKSPAFWART